MKNKTKDKRMKKGGTRKRLPTPGGPDIYEDEMPVIETNINNIQLVNKVKYLDNKVRDLVRDEKEIRQEFLLINEDHEEIKEEIEQMKKNIENHKPINNSEVDDLKNEIVGLKKEIEELKNNMFAPMLSILTTIKNFEYMTNAIDDFYISRPQKNMPGFVNPKYDIVFDTNPVLLNKPFYSTRMGTDNIIFIITKIGNPVYLEKHTYIDPNSGAQVVAEWNMYGRHFNGFSHVRLHYAVEWINEKDKIDNTSSLITTNAKNTNTLPYMKRK